MRDLGTRSDWSIVYILWDQWFDRITMNWIQTFNIRSSNKKQHLLLELNELRHHFVNLSTRVQSFKQKWLIKTCANIIEVAFPHRAWIPQQFGVQRFGSRDRCNCLHELHHFSSTNSADENSAKLPLPHLISSCTRLWLFKQIENIKSQTRCLKHKMFEKNRDGPQWTLSHSEPKKIIVLHLWLRWCINSTQPLDGESINCGQPITQCAYIESFSLNRSEKLRVPSVVVSARNVRRLTVSQQHERLKLQLSKVQRLTKSQILYKLIANQKLHC